MKAIKAPIVTAHRRTGSALISALFIMTLVAIAATAMSSRLQLDIYRTQLTILSDKLYLASQAVTFWAMSTLKTDEYQKKIRAGQEKILDFPDKLAFIYPPFKVTGGLFDLQSHFNLNNIQDKKYRAFFLRLLQDPELKLSANQQSNLMRALEEWTSAYQPGRGLDQYRRYYLKQMPPYLPAYQPLHQYSEFRLINGVDAALYEALSPLTTALPEQTPININTASPVLLKALGNGLNESQLEELITARGEKGFANLNKLNPLLQKLAIPNEQITLESQYFLSIAVVTSEDLNLVQIALLKRMKDKKGKIIVNVVRESLNTDPASA